MSLKKESEWEWFDTSANVSSEHKYKEHKKRRKKTFKDWEDNVGHLVMGANSSTQNGNRVVIVHEGHWRWGQIVYLGWNREKVMEKCRARSDVNKYQTKNKKILCLYFILHLVIGGNYQAKIKLNNIDSKQILKGQNQKEAFCTECFCLKLCFISLIL